MNPLNTDKKKINGITFMVIDGFNLKPRTINSVIKNCFDLFQKDKTSYALIICPRKNIELTNLENQIKGIVTKKDIFNL
jgi:hypothetical protein